jgi:ATP-dependent Lhr-like helicase
MKPQSEFHTLDWAHPIVRDWFVSKFGTATEPQEQGWPHIVAGRTTLISAPTGSGKTLAAFLACIERLVRKALSGELSDRMEVLYVSPLRALSNDIQKNLQGPLSEILQLAKDQGAEMREIRTAVRTGDTLTRERLAMLRRPPHILVTTPESLYILLTAEKSRAVLQHVQTVIVDEIHAVADDKRGAHLALSLERLDSLALQKPVRIGLSATQKPIEEVAHFLGGVGRPDPVIVNIGHRREIDLAVEVPESELGPVASHELWDEVHERIAQLVNTHRSTLIFVNTRKLAERTAHQLAKKLGGEAVASHHGSLSRKLRLSAEKKLKSGELRALVATASLELGIDIGTIDLVCQIGSPRAIAVGLQRIGRSGHWRGAVSKGRLFPTTRDELVECAALVRGILSGDLDRLMIPEAPLDILAQQITAMCAAEEWQEDKLYQLVCRAYPYRNLTRERFDSILEMLSEGIAASRGRYGAYLHRDRVQGLIRSRRGTRMIAITSGGAIPETGNYTVVAEPEGNVVGTLDEDFAVESNQGDVILLGNTSWMIRRVQSNAARVLVEDAHGAPPTVPFWRGEAPARTQELSAHIANLREVVAKSADVPAADRTSAVQWLTENCGVDQSGAEQILTYIYEGRAILGEVPTQKTIIAERFFDEAGGMQLVIHAPFGARINKAWGLALRKRFCRSFNLELQAAATDDGLNISLTEQHSFPLADVFRFLHSNSVEGVLTQAAFASPVFATRWRWDAMRSLAVIRFQRGKKVPLQILRMRTEDLLASVFPEAAACQDNVVGDITLPDHPLIHETMKDVLQEAMDLDGLKQLLYDIQSGTIRCVAVDTPIPSPFAHEILNANPYAYLDDAPLEERRARAVSMRRVLPKSILSEVGMLDPAAIQQVVEQCWPDVRTADELHDALLTFIALPNQSDVLRETSDRWRQFMEELSAQKRVGVATQNGVELWFAAEKFGAFQAAYPEAQILRDPADIDRSEVSNEEAIWMIVRGWMPHSGPVTAEALAGNLKLPVEQIENALLRLESSGAVLRGNFTAVKPAQPHSSSRQIEWCDRRILARIHRLTLGTLRKQIEPVTAAQFVRWLFRWQHVAPGTQLRGEQGMLEVLRQLQGFEVPARAWEAEVLARRIVDYNPGMLDKLCWSGVAGWGRFSSPSSLSSSRRSIPGSAAPITFFLREEADWLRPNTEKGEEQSGAELSFEARSVFESLKQRGASFLLELVRSTKLAKSDVLAALWELVSCGLVTADGFDSLRSLLENRRKARASSRSGAGRWSLLYRTEEAEPEKRIAASCRMLLDRYGVVFRDLVQRETLLPRWRELLLEFRRMEDRGEIRGGRFVSGFVGEQFALPLAVDSLRAIRKIDPSGETLSLSAADPLNLIGIILPGERIPVVSRNPLTFCDGVPVQDSQALAKIALD